jgi:hypothetical protein
VLSFVASSAVSAADYPSPIFKDVDVRGVLKLPGTGYPYANAGAASTYSMTIPLADISGLGTGVATALAIAADTTGGAALWPVAASSIAPIAANSVLCNATGSSAAPTACTTLPSGLTNGIIYGNDYLTDDPTCAIDQTTQIGNFLAAAAGKWGIWPQGTFCIKSASGTQVISTSYTR